MRAIIAGVESPAAAGVLSGEDDAVVDVDGAGVSSKSSQADVPFSPPVADLSGVTVFPAAFVETDGALLPVLEAATAVSVELGDCSGGGASAAGGE